MNEWRKVKLGEVITYVSRGITPKYSKNLKGIIVLNQECIRNQKLNLSESRLHADYLKKVSQEKIIQKYDILINSTGVGTLGRVCQNNFDKEMTFDSHITVIRPDKDKINPLFLGYSLKNQQSFIESLGEGSTGQTELKKDRLINELEVKFPLNMQLQKKISKFLSDIDEKIELNNKINDNLEKLIFLIYQNIFSNNIIKKECKMNEYFDISIGKTPPRKNQEYFSNNSNNNLWVSILDMKSSGIYINKSSEYLTDEAIKKCNIKIIPKNTLLLSFKLTIGRIAITYLDKTTTNEAIAHFLTDKKGATEYLYCYLKKFNFNTLGSTSSIATAVNSKIIKEMPFIIPQEKDLENFYNLVKPLFENIKNNQIESEKLTNLKNYLLPKLMNGEIDVENIEL